MAAAIGPPSERARPGVKRYNPTQLVIDPVPQMECKPTVYPLPKILYLPAIQEKVPAFEGTLRISRDVKVSSAAEFWGSLGKEGKTFTISAESSNTRPVTRPFATGPPRFRWDGKSKYFPWIARARRWKIRHK
ncbi:MAG: hypothetical protein AUH13_01205 [Acidobacteria bacterium 13_2_20CM_58_27]|nr:MAG: hypothetical protein AUH13_01205 [Acidobacteria bacterium 13_2_20CM_58_27]